MSIDYYGLSDIYGNIAYTRHVSSNTVHMPMPRVIEDTSTVSLAERTVGIDDVFGHTHKPDIRMKMVMTEAAGSVGGQELAVLLYAEGLRSRGHDLELVVQPDVPIYQMAVKQKISVLTVPMRRENFGAAFVAIHRILRRYRPDIVHVNSSHDSWLGALAARLVRPRPKNVRSRHEDHYSLHRMLARLETVYQRVLKRR